MSKLDELKKSGQIGASFGAGGGTPASMDLGRANGLPPRLQGVAKDKEAHLIPVEKIVRDEQQPREEFDPVALERLAESLRTRGQLQSIRVRWSEEQGAYIVVAGERRWRAAALAGLPMLRCVVQETPGTTDELLAIQLIENALREDLKPIEQAKAYRRLMDSHGWSGGQVARELAVDPSVVSRALSLLELPEAVQAQVDEGKLAVRSAAEIARIDDPVMQAHVAQVAVDEGLKRDEVVELARSMKARRPAPVARPNPVMLDLGDALVKISWKKSGLSAVQILRRALKQAQEMEKQSDDEAA